MSATEIPILVGVYENEVQAKSTVFKLQNAGFTDNQIGMVMHQGQIIPNHILDDLVKIGVREEDALLYESELEAGRFIVLVRHDGWLQEAFNCLYSITISGMSINKQVEDQTKASQASKDEDAAVWRLLKGVGLDHLL